ncbi:MAG: MoaD/ThiS family protein [Syntrophorhabdaceae bacterium]|nr:MoaD/ThiS family protein [Syntrophorhabdaceae bacterium]
MEHKTKRIKIKTNFVGSDFDIEVPDHYNVKDVVTFIITKTGKDLVKNSDLHEELEIFLNEKDIWFYPEKLETYLKEGDILEIFLTPLGGG